MNTRGAQPAGTWRRRRARSRGGRALQLAAVALSFILVSLLVVTSSRAAFVGQNDNAGNQVSAGQVDLTDNDAGTAMFDNVGGLVPGTPVDRCIEVTYSGTVDPLPVLVYATAAPTGTLAPYLNLTIDIGPDTADPFRTCTGFTSTATVFSGTLSAFSAAHGSYAAGRTTSWDPAGAGETRTFRFRVSVQNDPAAEGQTSTFGISWETRTS